MIERMQARDPAGRHDHAGHAAGHGHSHGHSHAHAHGPAHAATSADERRLAAAFLIILVFMGVEVAGGLVAGSLALLADAGHMLSDVAALGMSWAALRIGRRPADPLRSYGYRRLEVLVAFANGCALFVVTAWIAVEALLRLSAPVAVLGWPMLWVALAGLIANAVAFTILNGGTRENLNLRSAWLHVLGDLLGFAVTILAALAILWTGWSRVDPLLSLLVAALILRSALGIVRSSAHILLEGAPEGFDGDAVRTGLLAEVPGVGDVHHIHAWSLTAAETFVTLHVRCSADANLDEVVPAISRHLEQRFGITHSTVQIDHAECVDEHHSPPRAKG
jgi:cobalt-zinc-cadmium efflux system protein